ncbi:MAG: ParB/RepB/Spo0J family partition protein [Planctomycetota bacterium]|jgi:hypothetical protein
MQKSNSIQRIELERLVGHPDNPNRQSGANFRKLVRNIERSGRYEPIVVRPHPEKKDYFQIINGHHRCRALKKTGYRQADCVVWDVDDEQTDILLATLNQLGGTNEVDKKAALLKRLSEKRKPAELGKLLPGTAKQIERLSKIGRGSLKPAEAKISAKCFVNPMVFFLDDSQRQVVENGLSLVGKVKDTKTKAAKNASALTAIAQYFVNNSKTNFRSSK